MYVVLDVTIAVAEDYTELDWKYLPVPLYQNIYKINVKTVK
jgi:hypothetical protein